MSPLAHSNPSTSERIGSRLVGVILLVIAGCASTRTSLEAPLSLVPGVSPESSPRLQKALLAGSGSSQEEKARIDYLLERISQSPYNFIRNGSRYSGQRASFHLRWKHFRNRERVKTAEDFIQYVATGSKMSGEPYLIESNGKRHPLHLYFTSELRAFDQALEKAQAEASAQTAKTS